MHSHQSSPHLLPVGAWDSVRVKDFPDSDLWGQVPCKAFLVRWGVVNALFFLKNCLEPPWQVHVCRGLGSSGLRHPPPLGTAPSLAVLVPGAAQEVAAVGWARGLCVRPLELPRPPPTFKPWFKRSRTGREGSSHIAGIMDQG